ncbi:trans-aconitate 2-methyltransferase [Gordonia sp. ABSL49_1]|uniref:class I SAM-dependent methyltransferase n=1 Tax=Gordonia sp. ABSL49_1 TaxID=2920941 RepID=UPI001F0DAD89|nr:class I SAM-dependent methyltransferase [Gordonia sp. ABSL49_1]MCH5642037.1 class I SAM-dependent methyltransferase [Gordonia sp. ABSL49_1]
MSQPGYDALAALYADTCPTPYITSLERHAVHAFADTAAAQLGGDVVVDIGCGLGHVTADLHDRGLPIVGIEPSAGMVELARTGHPHCEFIADDAHLRGTAADLRIGAILARFSLIHVSPSVLPQVLRAWSSRLSDGSPVLIACQTLDRGTEEEFDHRVARAWLRHPDHLAAQLKESGFDEVWRMISRPDDEHRFPELHLLARRRP